MTVTYFLCLRYPLRPRDGWSASLQDHLDWMKSMHDAGSVYMSGPARDHSVSIYVIRAGSLRDATAIAAADPFTASGDCRFEIIDWDVHQLAGVGSFIPAV
ncbi:MAG: YciI family protein [Acidimicrobiia bacterium]|nr:YciI family protein [Acidimicrobiia bacterium]